VWVYHHTWLVFSSCHHKKNMPQIAERGCANSTAARLHDHHAVTTGSQQWRQFCSTALLSHHQAVLQHAQLNVPRELRYGVEGRLKDL
jgi:hypothetical protein